ncbi:microviridin/marinostatin family tricyclic proteinase inhibitor [Nostoc sp. FACHB-87]|uniref:microviridin/marinostatin family tricyclic proteinase inhibitor n=1 Tax=Nostocales TaxID=1161 RepID=UPI0016839687|nr:MULTISPECIES: microviridin/marinostatin family tricyclic proteinase inhibitor [Nostocales]MBD2454619.1 microviridin/marinostatin family tricyclic proteinase inhibitor [Nostoc sp. FACHB-87]MBD2476336.1 microviridin/marinostatin family tricyclic proteinase inhibitor [Anabaena sp. FACHB-83]MBD2488281.1 microviridin/marinostatin family tricyclic proteinase inhibitor [Aulosira sp. FACHB-615]
MSASINEAATLKAVPFFAYFLEAQYDEEPPKPSEEEPQPIPIWTLKWPSDWEER